jgi:2-oxoglutarate dehydrogenase E2 component (dihydrolipoamide succinyltransferase)
MTIEIKVPPLGESVSEAAIAKLYKKVGDSVRADELIVELETDKVTLEVNAPKDGVITALKVKQGDNVKVGDVIAELKAGAVSATNVNAAVSKSTVATDTSSASQLSPAPKKLAAENKIDTAKISGTGKDGRVTKGDVLEVINSAGVAAAPLRAVGSKPVERVRMSKLRQKVAERLKESQNTAAILTTFNEVDMSSVMALRAEYKDLFEKKHNVKLGFMSFFVKAVIAALKEIPAVNAEIDGSDIIRN